MAYSESYVGDYVIAKKLAIDEIEINDEDFNDFNFDNVEKPKISLTYDKEKYSFNNENSFIKIEPSTYQTFVPSDSGSGSGDGSGNGSKPKNKIGMIVGIVVAVVVVVVIIVVVIIVIRKKRANGSASEAEEK